MKKIPKAETYGEKNNWQVDPDFCKELRGKIITEETVYEELLDDILVSLVELGYLEWEGEHKKELMDLPAGFHEPFSKEAIKYCNSIGKLSMSGEEHFNKRGE